MARIAAERHHAQLHVGQDLHHLPSGGRAVEGEHFAHFRRFMAGRDESGRDHPGVFDRAVLNAAIAKAQGA